MHASIARMNVCVQIEVTDNFLITNSINGSSMSYTSAELGTPHTSFQFFFLVELAPLPNKSGTPNQQGGDQHQHPIFIDVFHHPQIW